MAKPDCIELADGTVLPILYEDRAVLAIDKPAGWMLAPASWTQTSRNLQLTLERSIRAGDFWARARGLRFVRYVHRLDAGTTGVLLLAKSPGVLRPFTRLFEGRRVLKRYLAVVHGCPAQPEWVCRLPLARLRRRPGVVKVEPRAGKPAETRFRVLQTAGQTALVEAQPITGRTHQIRVHLAAAGHPVLGDALYAKRFAGKAGPASAQPPHAGSGADPALAPSSDPLTWLALRAVRLEYPDPFSSRWVRIEAPSAAFLRQYGFCAQDLAG